MYPVTRRPHTPARRKQPRKPPADAGPLPPGLLARQLAADLITAVLAGGHTLDGAVGHAFARAPYAALDGRDKAFARLAATTVLRRLGEIEAVLTAYIGKPLPARRQQVNAILLAGAAQLLFLGTPAYAAVGLAVDQCRLVPGGERFGRLVNAVLRRVADGGAALLAQGDPVALNIPAWLRARWDRAYGPDLARAIAEASLSGAALDLTVKRDGAEWAGRLGGVVLPTGSVRLPPPGRIEDLPGYAEGAWWVQDAAAALPVRLLGDVAGCDVADLCAAPGGKTAGLAAAGARVTAADISAGRLERVRANLSRLGLAAQTVCADAASWAPGRLFSAVLLDAPCSATGTIRRHPDILRLKREADIAGFARTQERLLENAARLAAPGGLLVYCVCSLESEEGPDQIRRFLAAHAGFVRVPVQPGEAGIEAAWITGEGDLRTLPCHLPSATPGMSGLDGFFAARLRRA